MTNILSLPPLAGSLEDCAWLACRSALNACFFWQGNKYVYSHSGYGQERLSQLSSSMTFRVVEIWMCLLLLAWLFCLSSSQLCFFWSCTLKTLTMHSTHSKYVECRATGFPSRHDKHSEPSTAGRLTRRLRLACLQKCSQRMFLLAGEQIRVFSLRIRSGTTLATQQ